MELHNPDVHRQGNMLYVRRLFQRRAARLRQWSAIRASSPTETAWFIPPERADAPGQSGAHASPINWSEDVTEDARGYIYMDDDKWGIWILRDPGQDAADAAGK